MKLKRENFKKEVGIGNEVTYSYECNGSTFKMVVRGENESDREIYVYKVDYIDDQHKFTDVLDAWNYFEELLKECEPEQQSSGGYMRNPQQNPNIMPLIAVGDKITFFVVTNDGGQVSVIDLDVKNSGIPTPVTDKPFIVDWSNEDVPDLFKCEIIMKKTEVVFEDDTKADVFLFIPKSMISQGGQEGGGTEPQGEPQKGEKGEKGQKGKKAEKKEKQEEAEEGEGGGGEEGEDEEGEEAEGEGEGEGQEGEAEEGEKGEGEEGEGEGEEVEESEDEAETESGEQGEGGEEGEGEEGEADESEREPEEGEGEFESQEDKEVKGWRGQSQMGNFSALIQRLSDCTNTPNHILVSTFRNVQLGEVFLLSLNFTNIKECMGLPADTTPKQLSQLIINSK